jgi:hypothetical protein
MFVDLAAEGDLVAAVWQEQRSGGNDVHTNVSTDGGLTWAAADTRLDRQRAGCGGVEEPRRGGRQGDLRLNGARPPFRASSIPTSPTTARPMAA